MKEVRLAVVMYGGVSLAIYINGVVQELYELVRATAPVFDPSGSEPAQALHATSNLTGSGRVYRKLGQLLNGDGGEAPAGDTEPTIFTRFIVDILSGSSAGGINGIYLAKALANDQPLDQLKQLWIDEGDIGVLLNDRRSLKGIRNLAPQVPPKSLLNSRRMYRKLLDAFEGMEVRERSPDSAKSPYLHELDLWVTATDITGLLVSIKLASSVATELRHRNVFHFVYATEEASGDARNDFHADNNPFLAFAARCTSSFPFAFEPMALQDIDEAMAIVPPYAGRTEFRSDTDKWSKFYPDYLVPGPGPGFAERAFGDGGSLDNKPFTWSTDTLLRRRADLPVDRILVFVEPDPGRVELTLAKSQPPDVLDNVLKQALTLPRAETIREDVQALQQRNRLIRRMNGILGAVERDMAVRAPSAIPAPTSAVDWASADLTARVQEEGASYGGYQRLKVEGIVGDLARLMARVAGLGEESDEAAAIQYLVGAWKDLAFVDYRGAAPDAEKPTLNQFLLDFDLPYRLRRVNFLQAKVDETFPLTVAVKDRMEYAGFSYWPEAPEDRAEYRAELIRLKRALGDIYVRLRKKGRDLRRRTHNPLSEMVAAVGLQTKDLNDLLELATEEARHDYAKAAATERFDALQALAAVLSSELKEVLTGPSGAGEAWRQALAAGPGTEAATEARRLLAFYYDNFDEYDMVAFPMTFGTDLGESDVVELVRISPLDAPALINEQDPAESRRKLAGSAYGHFGGFLDRLWRENDMMWGRLDAAECLIQALIPSGFPDRATLIPQLVKDAQTSIIAEELRPTDRDTLLRLVGDALAAQGPPPGNEAELRKRVEMLVATPPGSPVNTNLQAVLRSCLSDDQLRAYIHESYEVERKLPPKELIATAARGAHVAGEVLKGAAAERPFLRRPSALVAKVGQLASGLVEVAIRPSLGHTLYRHWLALLYVFELLMIGLGLGLGVSAAAHLGTVALGVTVLVNLVVWLLTGALEKATWIRRAITMLAVLLVVSLFLLAFLELQHLTHDIPLLRPLLESTPTPSP